MSPAAPPAVWRWLAACCWTLALGLVLGGCHRSALPAHSFVVSDVRIDSERVPVDDLIAGLATARSPRVLGIASLVYDYEVYDETLLARDLERVERYYRARGYYEAKVTAARVVQIQAHHGPPRVRVEIHVEEGRPVLVRSWSTPGIERLPSGGGRVTLVTAVTTAVTFRVGDVFDEAVFDEIKQEIEDLLANHGYAFAKVEARANVDLTEHAADLVFAVEAGPRARFGKIVIQGLEEIPERKVRAQLRLSEGQVYSRRRVRAAQDSLTALERFSNVEIIEDVSRPESGVVPLTVIVKEASLRGVRAGVGARFDVLKFSNSALLGWEDRNFLGGMRSLRVEDRFALNYFPLRFGLIEAPIRLLPENHFRVTLRQPSFLEGRTEGVISGDASVYPVLYRLDNNVDPEQERIIGFFKLKGTAGARRAFLRRHLTVQPAFNWEENIPVIYRRQGSNPEGLDPVRVIYPDLFLDLDFRDDPVSPRQGFRLMNTLESAGVFGLGDLTDIKVQPRARAYLPLIEKLDVTLAARATVGFLFPQNYGQTLDPAVAQYLNASSPTVIRDQAKLLFRVFYSGGPNSNRGYPYQSIGPHGPLGFLEPSTIRCSFDSQDPRCFRPLGGLSLWEASLELRYPIWGALGAVTFIDASDVRRERAVVRFDSPHLSPGVGMRYETPVGPIRFDVGYRLDVPRPPADVSALEPAIQDLFGLPIAVHVMIGQAF